ncbi:aldo/keto reductase [Streptomyces geranii]|uniref:aldo/keto reductase n=1 Tax=Streptomyces geranii TaxID=2058923 RepID=UPI000D042E35|nr:aldo/keto reductase [Streptomyces geranii]
MRLGGSSSPFTGVRRLGLGGMALGGAYGPIDHAEAVRLVQQALDAGVVLLDTADASRGGRVRRIVGQAVASRRDEALIAVHSRPFGAGAVTRVDSRGLVDDCEEALRQLGVDHIDLYVVHLRGLRVPIEEQMGELAGLLEAGKIRRIGVGGVSGDELVRAHAIHPVAVVAAEYSLWQRQAERDLLPLARRRGIGLMACQPLGRGLLTGRITDPTQLSAEDLRHTDPCFSVEKLSAVRSSLRVLEAVAADMSIGAGRLALAWLLSCGEDIIPVPSTRDRVHLEMNLSARDLRLTRETQHRLSTIFSASSEAREEEQMDLTSCPGLN